MEVIAECPCKLGFTVMDRSVDDLMITGNRMDEWFGDLTSEEKEKKECGFSSYISL